MAKTKLLRDKVAKMETAASALENQRSMLLAVNEKCVKIDAVAKSVSWGRVNLLTSLQQTMETVWLQRVKDLVTSYTSESFHTAWNQYTTGLNGISGDPENVLKIRLGKEILTLWRKQLDTDSPVYLLVNDAFHQLSTQAQAGQSLPTLQVYPNKTSTTSNKQTTTVEGEKDEDYTSSTVVLYNTLNYHETPTDHVESQARTQTAAKLILQRFHQQQNIQEDERQRSLALRESNDITAVPMYCLPLVHSPQYLNRLYTFAKEAEQEDLYVPLEFDTEWETDIGYSSSGSEDLSEDELFTGRLSRWAKLRKVDEALLRPALESHLSTDHIRQLVKVINPTRQEFRLASVLSKQAANHPHHLDDRDDDDDGEDDHDESPRRLSPNRKYAIGRRVQTTYGDGLIINDHPSRPFPMYTIRLQWGAQAILNEDTIILAYRKPRGNVASDVAAAGGGGGGAGHRSKGRKSMDHKGHSSSSGTPKSLSLSQYENRFKNTDLKLHKLIRRILAITRLNRFVVEHANLRDANFSLWMHGRTSGGLNRAIETDIRRWLIHYDPDQLHTLLLRYEALPEMQRSTEAFTADLKKIRVPPAAILEDEFAWPVVGSEEDAEELWTQAVEYCHVKLTTKSGTVRVFGPRKRRDGKRFDDDDDGDDDESDGGGGGGGDEENGDNVGAPTATGGGAASLPSSSQPRKRARKVKHEADGGGDDSGADSDAMGGGDDDRGGGGGDDGTGPRKRRRREKRLPMHNPVWRSDLPAPPDNLYRSVEERQYNEDLRFLFARICQRGQITQTDVMHQLNGKIGFQCGQANVSAWARHRMGVESIQRYNQAVIRWIGLYEAQLIPEEVEVWQIIRDKPPVVDVARARQQPQPHRQQQQPRPMVTPVVVTTATASTEPVQAPVAATVAITENSLLARLGATVSSSSTTTSVAAEHTALVVPVVTVKTEKMDADDDISRTSSSSSRSGDDLMSDDDDNNGDGGALPSLSHSSVEQQPQSKKATAVAAVAVKAEASVIVEPVPAVKTTADGDGDGEPEFDEIPEFSVKATQQLHRALVAETNRRLMTHLYLEGEAKGVGLTMLMQPVVSKFVRTQAAPSLRQKDLFCYDVQQYVLLFICLVLCFFCVTASLILCPPCAVSCTVGGCNIRRIYPRRMSLMVTAIILESFGVVLVIVQSIHFKANGICTIIWPSANKRHRWATGSYGNISRAYGVSPPPWKRLSCHAAVVVVVVVVVVRDT